MNKNGLRAVYCFWAAMLLFGILMLLFQWLMSVFGPVAFLAIILFVITVLFSVFIYETSKD